MSTLIPVPPMETPVEAIDERYQLQLSAKRHHFDEQQAAGTSAESRKARRSQPPEELFAAKAQLDAADHAVARGDVAAAMAVMGRLPEDGRYSREPPWEAIKLCFLASSCMYLRNADKVAAAAAALAASKLGEASAEAIELLKESHAHVDLVCAKLGLRYVTVCDMVEDATIPGNYNGPFCGAFFRVSDEPFIILTFRGTATFLEWVRDFNFKPVESQDEDGLWRGSIHQGFYTGMFGQFAGFASPFQMIQEALEDLAVPLRFQSRGSGPVPVYCTGHSLAGAYATLAFAAHLHPSISHHPDPEAREAAPPYLPIGLYTFGAPRVGLHDFAAPVMRALRHQKQGRHIWRVVNARDPVAFVPAWWYPRGILHPRERVGFYHLDRGVHLDTGVWRVMKSELAGAEEPEREREARKLEAYCSAYPARGQPMVAPPASIQERPQATVPQQGPSRRSSTRSAVIRPSLWRLGSTLGTLRRFVLPRRKSDKQMPSIESVVEAAADLPKLDGQVERRAWTQLRRSMTADSTQGTTDVEAEGAAITLGLPNVFHHSRKAYWEALRDLDETARAPAKVGSASNATSMSSLTLGGDS